MQPCRISAITHILETEFMPIAMNKGLSLTVKNVSDAVVLTDKERIIQIGNNLLSNAIKFTEEGGVSLTTNYTNGVLTITVKDTGTGMTEDEQQQVFGAFDDVGGGVDVVDHRLHNVDLALADGAVKCDGLAVDVAGRDDVLIQNHEVSDAAAGKCLAAVGAHAAAAEYQYCGVGELVECLAAHDDLELGVARFDGGGGCVFSHRCPPMGK